MIVAIDGVTYHDTIDNLVDLLSSGEEGDMWLLSIWRNGKFLSYLPGAFRWYFSVHSTR